MSLQLGVKAKKVLGLMPKRRICGRARCGREGFGKGDVRCAEHLEQEVAERRRKQVLS